MVISEEKRQAVIGDYVNLLPAREIARRNAIHLATVFRIVRHLSLPRRKTGPKGKFPEEVKGAIVADYMGMSVNMLMKKYALDRLPSHARLIHVLYKGAPIFLDRKMVIAMSVIGNPDYDLERMEEASLRYGPKS